MNKHNIGAILSLIAILLACVSLYVGLRETPTAQAGSTLYYELTIGSFTAVHAYGGFATYEDAQARVTWLKANGYMEAQAAYFIQPRHLGDPLVVLDAREGAK